MAVPFLANQLALIANQSDKDALQKLAAASNASSTNAVNTTNTQGPFAAAQQYDNNLSQYQQKSPVVFEFVQSVGSDGTLNWTSVQLYINPNQIQMSMAKVNTKQITRGGVFYNMWGDDNASMQISGYTGLAGMQGIAQLEQIYYASGTMLAYQNFGPQQVKLENNNKYPASATYQDIDMKDPIGFIAKVQSTQSTTQLKNYSQALAAQSQYANSNLTSQQVQILQYTANSYANAINNVNISNTVNDTVNQIYQWQTDYMTTHNSRPSFNDFYQQASTLFMNNLPTLGSQIITSLAYQITQENFQFLTDDVRWMGSSQPQYAVNFSQDQIYNPNDGNADPLVNSQAAQSSMSLNDMAANMMNLSAQNATNIINRISDLTAWYQRESNIRTQLQQGILSDTNSLFSDMWRPRRVIMYFEDRAYIGHFDSFQYSRTADSPYLIQYTLKFVVEEQIVGVGSDGYFSGGTNPTNSNSSDNSNNGNVTITTSSSQYAKADAKGNLHYGSTYNQAVNEAGGQWIDHTWRAGTYNSSGQWTGQPLTPASNASGKLYWGNSYAQAVNAAGGRWVNHKFQAGTYNSAGQFVSK